MKKYNQPFQPANADLCIFFSLKKVSLCFIKVLEGELGRYYRDIYFDEFQTVR